MTNTEALLALAARVEAGETGREIEALVCEAIQYDSGQVIVRDYSIEADGDCIVRVKDGRRIFKDRPPQITTSLDAIAALTKRVLPEAGVNTQRSFGPDPTYRCIIQNMHAGAVIGLGTEAPTEPAARLAALLRALAEKEKE